MLRQELNLYLNQLLEIKNYKDYCPNGLQVEGKKDITNLITGVTACQNLIDQAIAAKADAILVHHGVFWRGDDPCVTGMMRKRLAALLQHDINLYAYHLPLDAHPVYGNNIQLADRLNIIFEERFDAGGDGLDIGFKGCFDQPISANEFTARIEKNLGRAALHIPGASKDIETIAWCTGAAQGYIEAAAEQNVDAYLSGEVSEQTTHIARELGIHYFAAGHHATERYGVQALGDHLAEKFSLKHLFIDIDNPV